MRFVTPRLEDTLSAGMRVSPALRAIVHRLERSDLIVHVQGMRLDSRVPLSGAMRFVHAAGGRRFLRIAIDERLSGDLRVAALAHELYHALEVAVTPSVIDRVTFAGLYQRIGYESSGHRQGVCYETDGARRAGAAVLAELRMARALAPRSVRTPGTPTALR